MCVPEMETLVRVSVRLVQYKFYFLRFKIVFVGLCKETFKGNQSLCRIYYGYVFEVRVLVEQPVNSSSLLRRSKDIHRQNSSTVNSIFSFTLHREPCNQDLQFSSLNPNHIYENKLLLVMIKFSVYHVIR